ncbi:hypothetical protein NECID01_0010 [Nematocida sp. AWRm77]|nr:hypothetical protein NECID01_0010 [Nematocida sp. AWRm77]
MQIEQLYIVLFIKRKTLEIKRWVCKHSSEERFARKVLSNFPGDPTRDVGVLIAEAFSTGRAMDASVYVALQRLESKETKVFSKHFQYHKALLFLQKLCMESEYARAAVKHNYLKILPFVFYNKGNCPVSMSIRLLSISVLKMANAGGKSPPSNKTSTTFVTCVSHQESAKA